ncbi:MAG: hypothetical protein NVV62_04440 [Terricaulis sp.]|nr:hypothetical protein [Terricaulis sp.]
MAARRISIPNGTRHLQAAALVAALSLIGLVPAFAQAPEHSYETMSGNWGVRVWL